MSNWQLSDKTLGKANEIGTSFAIIAAGLETTGIASPFIKGIGVKGGYVASLSQASDNTIKLYNKDITPLRYSYKMTGTITSFAVAETLAIYGGKYGGPYGLVAGLVVGIGFQGIEYWYDTIAPQIQESFNHTFNALNSGNFVK